jgi:hypothetical protein
MKRVFAFIMMLLVVIPMILGGCADNGGKGGDGTKHPAGPDPIDGVEVKTWLSDGYEKVSGSARAPKSPLTDFTLYMAKHEKEGFHVSVLTSEDVSGLKLEMLEGDTEQLSVEIFEEYLIQTGSKSWPDPIVPLSEKDSFDTESATVKTLLVRFTSTTKTADGEHKFKFALKSAGGKVIQEYSISVNVWNFALPETYTCESAVGLNRTQIAQKEKIPGSKAGQYLRAYYDMLLDYGLSAYDIPYDLLNDKADEYMSDPRVKFFCVPYDVNDEKLVAYYEKIKSNPEWLEKAYFYPFDEPTSVEHLNTLAERCERLQRLCPEIDIVIPFFRNVQYSSTIDEIDFLDDYLGIWCPKSACWSEKWMPDPLNKGYFGDRMDEQKAQGDKLWWYVCWEPGTPYCNLYVNEFGIQHVQLFWQQYYYGVEGLLYWQTTHWSGTEDPWTDMATVKSLSPDVYGDGSLLYPGKNVGVQGPVASLRMECIRSGMEDFDLLTMAEELFGREWVIKQVVKVSESLTVHTRSNEVFNSTRKAIGDAIAAELGKG